MKEYLFYTAEGFTQAPRGNEIENCQLLGRALGKLEAFDSLLNRNSWILKCGFDPNKIIGIEIVSCDQ